jgi:hypothetical protein
VGDTAATATFATWLAYDNSHAVVRFEEHLAVDVAFMLCLLVCVGLTAGWLTRRAIKRVVARL